MFWCLPQFQEKIFVCHLLLCFSLSSAPSLYFSKSQYPLVPQFYLTSLFSIFSSLYLQSFFISFFFSFNFAFFLPFATRPDWRIIFSVYLWTKIYTQSAEQHLQWIKHSLYFLPWSWMKIISRLCTCVCMIELSQPHREKVNSFIIEVALPHCVSFLITQYMGTSVCNALSNKTMSSCETLDFWTHQRGLTHTKPYDKDSCLSL